jgi:hypothetical protein
MPVFASQARVIRRLYWFMRVLFRLSSKGHHVLPYRDGESFQPSRKAGEERGTCTPALAPAHHAPWLAPPSFDSQAVCGGTVVALTAVQDP